MKVVALGGSGAMGGHAVRAALADERAVKALDLADEVFTVWDLDGSGDGGEAAASEKAPAPGPNRPSAALVHFVQQITGKIRAWEQGALRDVRPLQKIVLEVPLGGNVAVHTVGHPESVTLPGTYPRLTRCTNAFTAKPATVLALKAIAKAVDAKLVSMERAARWIEGSEASPHPDEVPIATDLANPEAAPPLFALARGEKAGRPATSAAAITAGPRGGMGPITGIPLGIGLSLLASGAIDRPGVHPPEAVIEPHDFFRAFAPWCDPTPASPDDLVSVAVG